MRIEVLDGVVLPSGWEEKYPSIRYYKNRIRVCVDCSTKFFETREQVRPPRSLYCASCSVITDYNSDVHPDISFIRHLKIRTKICPSCDFSFEDHSRLTSRKFCYLCTYMYSPESLTRRALNKPKVSFRDKADEVIELYNRRLTDVQIAKALYLSEHQVRTIRLETNKPAWTKDDFRVSEGCTSIKNITKESLSSLTTKSLCIKYGVSAHRIKLAKRLHGVKQQIPHWYDHELNIDEFQIVLGTSLGDAHLMRRADGRYSLRVAHKKDHGSYIYWLSDRLGGLKPRVYLSGEDLVLATCPNIHIGKLARSLYDEKAKKLYGVNGQKAPRRELFNSLEALGLAVLYMDDGTLSNNTASIALYYPHIKDSDIIEPIKEKFNISLYRRSASKYSLFLDKNDTEKFLNIVAPHIAPIMSYKLPPSLRSGWMETPAELNGYHSTYYYSLSDIDKLDFEKKFFDIMQSKGPHMKYQYDPDEIRSNLSQARCKGKYCKWSRTGLSLLDEIFPHRMSAKRKGHKSVEEAWSDFDLFSASLKQLHKQGKIFTPLNIRQALINLVHAPAHFNPSVAASIINEFKPRRVLDPMIGWGGRSLAALSNPSVNRFVGCDLQENSVSSAFRLAKIIRSKTSYDFFSLDSVKWMNSTSDRFDMVISSPPFHDTELYEGVEYENSLNGWYENFLIPFLLGCKRVLSPSGRIVLHLEDSGKLHMIKLLHRALSRTSTSIVDTYVYNTHSRIEKEQLLYIIH
jgi:tRNA1(Val) A37 N6-methylase TrmN6